MNYFNPVHALTTLQMEILLIMRTYYNNNQKWNWPTKEEPVFHHLSNGNQFSILVTFFCYTLYLLFYFFQVIIFSIKTH